MQNNYSFNISYQYFDFLWSSFLLNAKLTSTQLIRELFNEWDSSQIQLESSLIRFKSTLIELESATIQLEHSPIQLESSLYVYNLQHSVIKLKSSLIRPIRLLNGKMLEQESSVIPLESFLIHLRKS